MSSRQPSAVVHQTRAAGQARALSEPQLGLGVMLGAYAIAVLWLTRMQPIDGRAFLAVQDIVGFLPAFFAAGMALLAGSKAHGNVRLGWILVGAGCLAWALGDVAWTYIEVILEQDPFPSLADVGYVLMLPLVAGGLIALTAERRKLSDSRPALDGLAVVLSAIAFVWLVALQPIYADSSASVTEKLVSGAYPIGDFIVIYALVIAVQRRLDRGDGLVLGTLLCGMIFLVSADVSFAYLNLHDDYSATSLVNVGWPFGFLLIGYAAALETTSPLSSHTPEHNKLPLSEWLLPAALGVLVTALAVAAAREGDPALSAPAFVMLGIASTALTARVAINFGLVREIEERREQLTDWLGSWTRPR